MARHCLTFCGALHAHHTNENGAFTVFEKEFPELAPVLDRLRREHHPVARALTDLQALLAGLTSGSTADADRLRAELERPARDLEEYLACEERPALGVCGFLPGRGSEPGERGHRIGHPGTEDPAENGP
ncbi:hemerythrin domain-containing protein [Streptosporangium sp. NPDC001681]|uniref:hemerythrin domain-containing protein n=1 Tax=Streptosporangium sp. NPDC001681 TaxID=3154395 RepID=UPI0033340CA3